MNGRKIRVLIVDDSALMRSLLKAALERDPEIEVAGAAQDPLIAREAIKRLNPDVVTLDIEMPRMDGLSFLRKIMTLRPMPVVMVSSLTQSGAAASIEALEIGAVDVAGKPSNIGAHGLGALAGEIVEKVKIAARTRPRAGVAIQPAVGRKPIGSIVSGQTRVVAIGASTGGVEALKRLMSALPAGLPPIVIVQHMPRQFTGSFAERLDRHSAVTVTEAKSGDCLKPGHGYVAPGGRHLAVRRRSGGVYCETYEGEPVSGHQPSADVLFQSVADSLGGAAVGLILTGMGRDGAQGLLAMREAGAGTFGQDEASCVVYGMPRAAFEAGAVMRQASLDRLPALLCDAVSSGGAAA